MRRLTWKRDGFWVVAGACATALILLTVLLYAVPRAAPVERPTVTVNSIDWTVVSGNASVPPPWFAEESINQSGPLSGFPFQVPVDGSFNDSLVLVNVLDSDVPVCSVTLTAPLFIVGTNPVVPFAAEEGEDNLLVLTLLVQAGAGANVSATGVITAGTCPLPA
jgi:hypothetical protein